MAGVCPSPQVGGATDRFALAGVSQSGCPATHVTNDAVALMLASCAETEESMAGDSGRGARVTILRSGWAARGDWGLRIGLRVI